MFEEIERSPRFARGTIAGLSQRIERLLRELDRQALGSGNQRFFAYLLRRGRAAAGSVVTLPAAKGGVTLQLNLTPEHFSRILHEPADAGLLQVRGRRISIPDRQRLEAVLQKG